MARTISSPNRHGWWGILAIASLFSVTAAGITSLVSGLVWDGSAAASAATAGLAVWLLSATTVLVIALVWRRSRDMAIPLTMGSFVFKIIILGIVLAILPTPEWLATTPAALGAVASIIAWQLGEILTFIRTRHQIYDS